MPMLTETPLTIRIYVAYLPAMAGGSGWGKSSRRWAFYGRQSHQAPASASGSVQAAAEVMCGVATFTHCQAVGGGPWSSLGELRIPEAAAFDPHRKDRLVAQVVPWAEKLDACVENLVRRQDATNVTKTAETPKRYREREDA